MASPPDHVVLPPDEYDSDSGTRERVLARKSTPGAGELLSEPIDIRTRSDTGDSGELSRASTPELAKLTMRNTIVNQLFSNEGVPQPKPAQPALAALTGEPPRGPMSRTTSFPSKRSRAKHPALVMNAANSINADADVAGPSFADSLDELSEKDYETAPLLAPSTPPPKHAKPTKSALSSPASSRRNSTVSRQERKVHWGEAHVVEVPMTPPRRDALYLRMRYYNRLAPSGDTSQHFRAPRHIFEELAVWNLYNPDPKSKQSSVVTIFALWNTMFGAGALVLPWAFTNSGLFTGLCVVLLLAAVCLYTATLILDAASGFDDFTDACKEYLGPWAYYLSSGASVGILVVVVMVYLSMMSDFVNSISCTGYAWYKHVKKGPTANCVWDDQYTPVVLGILLFPLISLRKADILVKFNSFGVLSIVYMLFFFFYECVVVEGVELAHVPEFNPNLVYLFGVMTTSYFIHNSVIMIMKNQAEPKNNKRDLVIAFALVCATYVFIGTLTVLAFPNVTNMPQNFINLFGVDDVAPLIARAMFVIQLSTLIPLLIHIARSQLFSTVYGVPYPDFWKTNSINIVIALAAVLVATFFPFIGTVIRYGGSVCGLIYVYTLPVAVDYMAAKRSGREISLLGYLLRGTIFLFGFGALAFQFT